MANSGNQGTGSGGNKTLLIVLSVCGVALLVCCGGGYWAYQKVAGKFGEAVTMDADGIRTMTAGISAIEIPEAYEPQMGMDLSGFGVPMKMVIYSRSQTDEPAVVLMQSPDETGASGMTREDFEKAMADQGHGQQIQVSSRERRIFDYAGEEYAFEFASGAKRQSDTAAQQASGVFPANGGIAFLTVINSEEDWDDDAVMQMIESTGGRYLRTEEVETQGADSDSESPQAEPVEESAAETDAPAE